MSWRRCAFDKVNDCTQNMTKIDIFKKEFKKFDNIFFFQFQRCIVQMGGSPTKVQYMMKPTHNVVQRPLSVVVPVVTVEGGGAQAVIANARTVLANQQQQKQQHHQTGSGNDNNTHQDLITQLNMARAQGLVVLQQWGDKQVLVHKATGMYNFTEFLFTKILT